MSECPSFSSCTCSSSHGGGFRMFTVKPICYCRENAVLRTARTSKNRDKQFWGCPNFKSGSDQSIGYNYFQWLKLEEIEVRGGSVVKMEELDATVVKIEEKDYAAVKIEERNIQKMTINSLEKYVFALGKKLNVVIELAFILCIMNVILLAMLLK